LIISFSSSSSTKKL